MATATPSPPPTATYEEEDNDNQQPPTPQESARSPPSPIEDVGQHQQFANSNSPYSSPRTSVGEPEKPIDREHPPPEDVEDEQELIPASPPPQDKTLDRQQSSAPTSPSSLPQPSTLPIEPAHPPENLTADHESPISKQPTSPRTGAEDPVESPNYRENPNPKPNSDHESPSPSSPTTLPENPSPKAHESPNDPSPSPQPITATPASPPLGVPLLHAVASASPTKPQTSPWTHQETANLIQAYQEKWYSLKKGPLKASQWEEVAITVAARCGYDEPTKTAKQCRHKIEKLRKRYRTERGKPRSKSAAWNFFKLMDNLEKGPLPLSSSQPLALVEYQKPTNSNGKKRKNDDGDSEFLVTKRSRSKSSNHHISNGGLTRDIRYSDGGHDRVMRGLRTPVAHKHKGFYQEDEEEEEDDGNEEDEDEEEGVAAQLAVEIKGFAEKFVKLENKKIEMIKDVERYRLEMENKRMEMILESQQMLVETVNKAFGSSHKTQKLSAN
ncbi:hypothetical protein L2E82_12946 [Cichorium intybus]|uniref:Uncharacterized protein n=1 Tax=Cichorium intybus TaxID=13427 RepID=A0ACB9GHB0_CICIN|nr:hypothetical protein L2E82_12946 [Cichorium intybus]